MGVKEQIATKLSNTKTHLSDSGPPIDFPKSVSNATELRDKLSDTDVFGEAAAEAEGYLNDALERFRITISLLDGLERGARVLELGSNPYLITHLLMDEGFDVTCANWFGEQSGFGKSGEQVVNRKRSGTSQTFQFDHFNIEHEPFPYDDDSFDAVFFCEILEHLPNNPTHVLAEIHRVLKPNGLMVLTTPNAVRLDNLRRMLAGQNVYEDLSGYGTYGRHNREYTVEELRNLLTAAGYTVDQLYAADIHPHSIKERALPRHISAGDRGDNLFVTARAYGEPRWPYPGWLYQSIHALRKVVRPDVAIGYNCDLQTTGMYDVEQNEYGYFRWMGEGENATALLRPQAVDSTLRIEGIAPPPESPIEEITLHAELDDQKHSWTIAADGQPFVVHSKMQCVDDCEIVLTTDKSWSPSEIGSGDPRRLSVGIRSIALVP